jgi:hypothetical protein
MKRELERIQNP